MKIYKKTYGLLGTNTYICVNENTNFAFIIDPGEDHASLISDIKNLKIIPKLILLTHGHFDHVYATKKISETFDAKVAIHENDKDFLNNPHLNGFTSFFADMSYNDNETNADIFLKDNDIIDVNTFTLKEDNIQTDKNEYKNIHVLHTPGHTEGSVCFIYQNIIFTGDTLFKSSYGRTDLFGGNEKKIKFSLKKLFDLKGDLIVFPGHGSDTTLNKERSLFGFYF